MFIKIKKAAMFGLDARIKKLCHTGLDQVSHALNNKHGAMFGLDARIALAIFGALSVISGAALYSAIKQAKVVATVAQLEAFAKAVEALYLDTGTELPLVHSDQLAIANLITNVSDLKGWNGPYITGNYKILGNEYLKHPKYLNIHLLKAQDNMVGDARVACVTDKPCYAWIHFTGVPSSLVKDIDKYVDGENDLETGKVEGGDYSSSVAGTHTLSYRIMPIKP